MPTALVTGITGQDGTLLARRLVAEGVEVHGLARSQDDVAQWVDRGSSPARLHVADLRDGAALARILAEVVPDEAYNLAGISSVAYSWEHPLLTGEVTGTVRMTLPVAGFSTSMVSVAVGCSIVAMPGG